MNNSCGNWRSGTSWSVEIRTGNPGISRFTRSICSNSLQHTHTHTWVSVKRRSADQWPVSTAWFEKTSISTLRQNCWNVHSGASHWPCWGIKDNHNRINVRKKDGTDGHQTPDRCFTLCIRAYRRVSVAIHGHVASTSSYWTCILDLKVSLTYNFAVYCKTVHEYRCRNFYFIYRICDATLTSR